MARVFATGRLYLESLAAEVRPFSYNQFIINDGKWYGSTVPAILSYSRRARWWERSAGSRPCVAILSGLMGYLVSRRMFGPRAAVLCAILLPLTTYFVLPSATLLSHSTAALASSLSCTRGSGSTRRQHASGGGSWRESVWLGRALPGRWPPQRRLASG